MPASETIEAGHWRGTRIAPSDEAAFLRLRRDPQVARTLSVDGLPPSEADVRANFAANLARWATVGYGTWIFHEAEGGAFVGYCGLRPTLIAGREEVELLYAILPEYWGQGVTTALAAAMLDVAFRELKLQEVIAYTLPTNRGSRRVLEKNGFHYERDIVHAGLPHVLYRVVSRQKVGGRYEVGQ